MSPRTSLRIVERLGFAVLLAVLPFVLAAGAWAGTFYSQGSLDATELSSWNSVREGGGSAPADFASGDVFVVQGTHTVTVPATWTVSGAGAGVQIESGGTLELNAASGALELGGDWTVDGGATFIPNGRTVSFNGASDQQVTSGDDAFDHLTISKSGGTVVLHGDLTVNGVLELVSGDVQTGSDVLVIGSTGSLTRTSGHVVGQLRKPVAAGNSSQTFEIGDASSYTPLEVTGQGAGFGSAFTLTASTSAGDHASLGSSGIATDRSINRTYALEAAGYSDGPFELACNFAEADVDGGATPSRFIVRRRSSGTWTATTTGARTASSTSATGLTGFGEFSIGEQAIDHYDVAATSPQVVGDIFTTSVSARDALNELVAEDNTTSVTMSSDGAAEFDADGNATFGDNAKTLVAGAFDIATRDGTAETLTLTATDANSKTGSRTGLLIQPALSITTTTLPGGTAGDVYSQPLAATGGTAPYSSWTVTIGALPAGLTLDSGTGVISGTPTTAETQAFTVQVGDAASHTAMQALSITVGPALSITTTTLPGGTAGDAYSQPLAATGGTAPYSNWTVTIGTLPAGLTLDSGTGVISGTPTTAETQAFTVQVGDAASHTATQALSITVGAALSITTTTLPGGTAGDAYSQALAAAGGTAPYSNWTVTIGTLPAGLTLDSGTGVISGTPTTAETQAFTVQVGDAASHTATQALSITVGPALSITTTTLPGGTAGDAYSQPLAAAGGTAPYSSWTVTIGALPAGLTLDSGTGVISGTPTTAETQAFTVQVGDAASHTATQALSITVAAGPAAQLSFVQQPTSALVGAVLSPAVVVRVQDAFGNNVPSEPVSLALVGTGSLGGYAPTNTDANGLATFSTLTVSQAGTGKVLEATAAALAAVPSSPFDISCPVLTLLPASLPNGTQASGYSQTITASGGAAPYSFAISSGSLPAGLSLSPTGALGGTPTVHGSFNFTVTATDAFGCTGALAYTLGIDSNCPAIAVLPASLPAASVTVPYSQTLSAGAGVAPFTFGITAGSLPAGLSLTAVGTLSGTPLASGPSTFTIGVVDANACAGTREYTLDVQALPAPIANLSTQTALSGNDADGTAKIAVTYTLPPGAVAAQVYRAPFGGYPRYDNAGGTVPAIPSYPPGAPWTLTTVTASGQTDAPATRDFWYYVAFATNAGGGRSGVSNRSAGSLAYHLGDVSNGFTVGQGNNLVGNEDVSLLGSNYGISEPEVTIRGVHYLDVGPTTDLLLSSRPFTDGRIDFEDFIVFATNYAVVSVPQLATSPATEGGSVADELRLESPVAGEPGRTITASLRFSGSGQVQGFSAALAWDATVVEPVSVTPSGWLEGQGGLVLSPRPGTVDAALLGTRAQGMTGEGEIASVTFRVLRAGEPGIRLSQALARDARNRPVELGTASVATGEPRAWSTMLAAPWPNPARRNATFEFSLARAGRVDLAVYSVDGRRVKTLVNDEREAGAWREAWDGTDESGHAAAPGLYYTRLQADDRRFTRRLVLLR